MGVWEIWWSKRNAMFFVKSVWVCGTRHTFYLFEGNEQFFMDLIGKVNAENNVCVCVCVFMMDACTFVPFPSGWPGSCDVTAERGWLNETSIIQALTVTLPQCFLMLFFTFFFLLLALGGGMKGIRALAFIRCQLQREVYEQITSQTALICTHTVHVVKHLCCKF